MSRDQPTDAAPCGPWNPGLRSPVPRDVAPLTTLYRPEASFTSYEEVRELSDFTGLAYDELVVFRPRRLVSHEVLIRVAANIAVPDGPGSEDLGVSLRRMAAEITEQHVVPIEASLVAEYEALRARVGERVRAELEPLLAGPPPPPEAPVGWLERLGIRRVPAREGISRSSFEESTVREWKARAREAEHEARVTLRALVKVVDAVRGRRGRVVGDADLLGSIVTGRVCNVLGSELIGRLVEPCIEEAIEARGYRRLPVQSHPVVMNTKGASAAGKSSMRPLQRALAARIGVDWADFALLSPDIFRKYLLDYETLGPAYKYAGMLTGEELRIIDTKLDRYMAEKAASGHMSHLLIDRFRFDSFAPESDVKGSNLLTRFGREIYLFFMVTPPHATVERAWERGLRVGRYKTVDDLLYHNVEAYGGMPELFFTWALSEDRSVHYEFLDNTVAKGEQPRTIAYGSDGALVVLDVTGLLDIERFRKIDIDATCPDEVYPGADAMAAGHNLGFLAECVSRLPRVDFADPDSGRIYLSVNDGDLVLRDPALLREFAGMPDVGAALEAIFPRLGSLGQGVAGTDAGSSAVVDVRDAHTLGAWHRRPPR